NAKVANPKPNPTPKAKPGLAADKECCHCHQPGHWKRNCKLYLASLKNRSSTSVHLLFILQKYFSLTLMLILGYLIPDRLLIYAIQCRKRQRVEALKEKKLTYTSAIMQE